MAPNRNTRPSRSGEIPDNFIVTWRKSEGGNGGANKPLVRRPITACSNCRVAKVRCNGQKACQRCAARGFNCTYTSTPVADRRAPVSRPDDPATAPPLSRLESGSRPAASSSPAVAGAAASNNTPAVARDAPATPEMPVPAHLDATATASAAAAAAATAAPSHPPRLHTTTAYLSEVDLQAMAPAPWANNSFGWGPVDPTVGGLQEQPFDSLAPSVPLDLGSISCMADAMPPPFPPDSYNPLVGHNDSQGTSSASRSPSSFGLPDPQASSSAHCPCRASLMLCVPKITSAMQEKRLDEVFKVTGEVFTCCQDIVDCKMYEVRCTDLLLIMAVLQETHPCFDHIAKSDLEDTVKVSFGGYEVSSNDANLRAMLVMDLVRRASTILTSISAKGQSMIDDLREPSCLAQANIAYLEATINHYRTILRCVTRYIEEAAQPDGPAFQAPLSASLDRSPQPLQNS